MDGELHGQLSDAVHELKKTDRKKSIDWAVQEGVRLWLQRNQQPTAGVQSRSAENLRQMLSEVLASGNTEIAREAGISIATFHRMIAGETTALKRTKKRA